VLPYYSWLAKIGSFVENHCSGFGTNSTLNHLLIVGGQTPTLRNPPRNVADSVWDMPSLPGHAADNGLTWKVYAGSSGYPVNFYAQLKGSSTTSSPTPKTARCRSWRWCGTTRPTTSTPPRTSLWAGQDLAGRGRHHHRRVVGHDCVPADLG